MRARLRSALLGGALAASLGGVALGGSGCLFAPQLEPHGYTSCEADDECSPGRSCRVGLCAPPPWFDDLYQQRRLLVVKNPSADQTLEAGAAVPVVFGEGGLLDIDALGAEGRFLTFDPAEVPADEPDPEPGAGWADNPIHRILEADRLLAWIPVPVDVPPGREGALSWIYTERMDQQAGLRIDPSVAFERYHTFPGTELDAAAFRVDGTGDVTVQDGTVILRDGTQLFALETLEPPFTVTATGRINGNLCDSLFLGLQGDDFVGSVPPYVGFFFREGLDVALDVVPTADSQPGALDFREIDAPGAKHRYSVEVNEGRVRLWVDDAPFAERDDLTPPMAGDPLTFSIDVDGACDFELESLWVTKTPFATPTVRAEPAVDHLDLE